jgi:hypothetical protein
MNIHMNYKDRVRLSCYQDSNFIDVECLGHEQGLAVDAYPYFHYIEVREKKGAIRTFYFRSKRAKREMDLGWWADAEVVWSKNEVNTKN